MLRCAPAWRRSAAQSGCCIRCGICAPWSDRPGSTTHVSGAPPVYPARNSGCSMSSGAGRRNFHHRTRRAPGAAAEGGEQPDQCARCTEVDPSLGGSPRSACGAPACHDRRRAPAGTHASPAQRVARGYVGADVGAGSAEIYEQSCCIARCNAPGGASGRGRVPARRIMRRGAAQGCARWRCFISSHIRANIFARFLFP